MGVPFKEFYNLNFLQNYSRILVKISPSFDADIFCQKVLSKDWQVLELKQRMRRISETLGIMLPHKFEDAISILIESIEALKHTEFEHQGIEFIFIPDYIELFGIDEYDTSVLAIEKVTTFISCEFAVRPFIIKYSDKMMAQMLQWTKHKNHHVRRLSSEGCRPRLPWAMALPEFKNNPQAILPILEELKTDDSEFVRRSVANNLNDISKDHPEIVLKIAHNWYGSNNQTNALIKHGLRTLLKGNYPGSLELIGYGSPKSFVLSKLVLINQKVKEGDRVAFSFSIKNTSKKAQFLRMEYALYFLLSNGSHSKKVFKISERKINPNESFHIKRDHSFKLITTRKYYKGRHFVAPIINGEEKEKLRFEII